MLTITYGGKNILKYEKYGGDAGVILMKKDEMPNFGFCDILMKPQEISEKME